MLEFFAALAVASQYSATFKPAQNPCQNNELAIDMGIDPVGGSIEILTPLADTHGKQPFRVDAERVVCVSEAELSRWITRAGGLEYDTVFEVTYDPRGTVARMRSQFDYSVLMCEELPDTPHPPRDLRLGFFHWSPQSGVTALRVEWHSNFRQKLEMDCDIY